MNSSVTTSIMARSVRLGNEWQVPLAIGGGVGVRPDYGMYNSSTKNTWPAFSTVQETPLSLCGCAGLAFNSEYRWISSFCASTSDNHSGTQST